MYAYGVSNRYYNNNGIVQFGGVSQQYNEFLSEMQKWYSEGLIDKNFPTQDRKSIDSMIEGNKVGALVMSRSNLDKWNKVGIEFIALPAPKNNNVIPLTQQSTYLAGTSVYISKDTKNMDKAIKFIEYLYSNDGIKSMKSVQAPSQEMVFIRGNNVSEFTQNAQSTSKTWANQTSVTTLPNNLEFPYDDRFKTLSANSHIDIYLDEITNKFIMGFADLSEFDKYVQKLYDFGLEENIQFYQQALDKYNNR